MNNWLRKQWQQNPHQPARRLLWARLYRLVGRNKIAIRGERNSLSLKDTLLQRMVFDIQGDDNQISFGPGARLANTLIRVRGHHHRIQIGENCTYQGGQIWVEDEHTSLVIGAGTTVVEASLSVTEPGCSIEIGPECMFAHQIDIRTGDSHSILDLESGERINYGRSISLGSRVWVAAGVTILKGVTIGDDCVVASRALVTHSFPPHCLIGGMPASVIREKISWKRERVYAISSPNEMQKVRDQ